MPSPLLLPADPESSTALPGAPSQVTRVQRELDLLSVMEHTWDVVHVLNSDGRIRYISPSVQRLLGYTPEEMIGTPSSDYVHPDDAADTNHAFEDAIEHPDGERFLQLRLRHKDGSWRTVEMVGQIVMDAGGIPIAIVNSHDVTEKRAAEEALREQSAANSLLQSVTAAANEAATLPQAMRACLASICVHTGWYVGDVLLLDSTGQLTSTGIWHLADSERFQPFREATEAVAFAPGVGLPGRVLVSGKAAWIETLAADPDFTRIEAACACGLRSGAAFPLLVGAEVVGVLEVFADEELQADAAVMELMEQVGTQLGRVVERERAREALRRSEERYAFVARATHDVVWDWDLGRDTILWSESVRRVFRYGPGEVKPTTEWWYNHIHPQDRQRVVTGVHAAQEGAGEFWSDEYRFLRGDGAYAVVMDRGYVIRSEDGQPLRMVGSMTDITERQQEEDAHRFLAQVSALLDASLDPEVTLAQVARLSVPTLADYCLVDLVDDQGGIRRAATAHRDAEKEGILLRDEYHQADADPDQHPVVQVVRTGTSILVREFSEAAFDGIEHDAEHRERRRRLGLRAFMIVPLVAHEKVLGAITLAAAESGRSYTPVDLMTAEDLARRAALAIDNATLYAKVQWAVRARDEVLGFVSHDLRNPLSTISLAASLLADPGTANAAKQQLAVATIGRAAHQMNAMVSDLLDITGIEAGRFSVSPSSQDVKRSVQQVRDSFAPIAAKKKVQLQYEVAPDVSTAWLDSGQISRVFSNLVGNAIKFTPEGGHITIGAERAGSEIRFSVADTGAGISAEQLPHVFDRFWQAQNGDRRGAGLGLAIAKGIAEAHRGEIWVESTPKVGSTFYFTVPRRCTPAPVR